MHNDFLIKELDGLDCYDSRTRLTVYLSSYNILVGRTCGGRKAGTEDDFQPLTPIMLWEQKGNTDLEDNAEEADYLLEEVKGMELKCFLLEKFFGVLADKAHYLKDRRGLACSIRHF